MARLRPKRSTEGPVPLSFSSLRQEQEWESGSPHPILRELVADGLRYAFEKHGWLWVTTCVFRTPEEDKELKGTGIHVAWRAVDIRTNNVPAGAVADVDRWLNATWVYDPSRLEMRVADSRPHGSGPHLHLQVHAQTRRRAG